MPRSTPLPSTKDRRRHPRVARNIPVKISSDAGDILTETISLSCSGAYCRISQRLEPMTVLKIQLLLPMQANDKVTTKKVSCQGVVVRSEAAAGTGSYDTAIFFNTIAPKDNRTIHDFVESAMEKKNYGKYN